MDPIYPRFAAPGSDFYEDPRKHRRQQGKPFIAAVDLDWGDWSQATDGHWTFLNPQDHMLPEQGWKIHLSTTASHATQILDAAAAHCHARRLPFKHLADDHVLFAMNAKDADRSASGKFITIYPSTVEDLRQSLEALELLTAGYEGPHILSDLRWRSAPVFVRYGGFRRMYTDVDGVPTAAIRDPEGMLVADIRTAGFHLPPWVDVPAFLMPSLEAQRDVTPPDGFPSVTRALHHSNAGGVYQAVDAGVEVVVKEARTFAGFTADGRDAVERVADEARVLSQIINPRVVRAIRSFDVLGHGFLVTERVDGEPLNSAVVARHPLIRANASASDLRAFREWALTVAGRIEQAVAAVHDSGYTHGDLHPGNFLVLPNDDVVLIDFEMARPMEHGAAAVIGAPGFVAVDGRRGVALDRYAVGCIKLFMFLPLTPLLPLHPTKAKQLISWAQSRFDLPDRWASEVEADINVTDSDAAVAAPIAVPTHIAQLGSQLIADATPEREDRLWPNDPASLSEPAYAIAHGALGPLVALREAGIEIPVPLMNWVERAFQTSKDDKPGLLNGLAGAALAFERLGMGDLSERALARLHSTGLDSLPPHLYGGLAGIGIAYLELSSARSELLPDALDIADRLNELRPAWRSTQLGRVATGSAGVLRGPSGSALFALRLYDCTGDRELLTLAEDAIRADLQACVESADGSLQVDEGWRVLPYLGSGSAGIALAIAHLLRRSPQSELRTSLDPLTLAAQSEFVLEPGLFQGRAGLVRLHVELASHGLSTTATQAALDRHLELFSLHALPREAGLGYPGSALLRRSCDLATGSAGVLLTLAHAWKHSPSNVFPPGTPLVLSQDPEQKGGDTHGIPPVTPDAGTA
ncbi:class III lanthionine synthetase LanKC [Microbacterium sp. NPDC058389]|uniref:class III lanthionine synthetase LanKC n=1 Tax=Microbacterium sp. NPDC058389 TaxID=3346475 RepID=UPI003653CFDE